MSILRGCSPLQQQHSYLSTVVTLAWMTYSDADKTERGKWTKTYEKYIWTILYLAHRIYSPESSHGTPSMYVTTVHRQGYG